MLASLSVLTALLVPNPIDVWESYPLWNGPAIHAVDVGAFSHDLGLDLFVLAGGGLHYHESAGALDVPMPVGTDGVVDVATLDGAGEGGRDVLLLTTGSGLGVLHVLPTAVPSFSIVDIQRPSFAGRRLIVLTYDGAPLVIGIGEHDLELLDAELASLGTIETGAPVADVESIDWDGVAGDELVVAVGDRLELLALNGQPLAEPIVRGEGGTLAVSRASSPEERDLIAWEVPAASGSVVYVANSHGVASRDFIGSPGGIHSFDYDGDHRSDLVRLRRSGGAGEARVFVRSGTGSSVESFSSLFSAAAPGGTISIGTPCFLPNEGSILRASATGDADGDGDIDLLLGLEDSGSFDLRFVLNQTIDEESRRLTWSEQESVSINGGEEIALIVFTPPVDTTAFAAATHFQLRQLTQGGATEAKWVPDGSTISYVPIAPNPPYAVTLTTPAASLGPIRIYEVTPVALDGTVIVGQAPSSVLLYVPDPTLYSLVAGRLPNGCVGGDPGNGCGLLNGGRGGCANDPP